MSACTSCSPSRSRPARKASSIRNAQPATRPPSCSTSSHQRSGGAARGQQVVVDEHARALGRPRRSAAPARRCRTRAGTRRAPSCRAACRACGPARSPRPARARRAGPSRKPRASAPITTSTSSGRAYSASPRTAASSAARVGQQRRDVAEDDPRLGEVRDVADQLAQRDLGRSVPPHPTILRRSRTSSRCLRCVVTAARFSSASIASLRRSALRERSAGARICCSSAASRSAEVRNDAQVAPADAVTGQLGDRADDLALGLVVVAGPGAVLALDDAVLLELGDQRADRRASPRRRPRACTARRSAAR